MNLRKFWRHRRYWLFAAVLVGPLFFYQANALQLRQFDRKIVLAWNSRVSRIRSIIEKGQVAMKDELRF